MGIGYVRPVQFLDHLTVIKTGITCISQNFDLSPYYVRIFLKSNSSHPRKHKTVVVSQVSPNVTPNYFAGEHKGWIVDNRSPIFGCFCTFPFFSGSLLGLYSRSTSFCSTTLPFYSFSTLLFSSLSQCVRLQGVCIGHLDSVHVMRNFKVYRLVGLVSNLFDL